jgi:hypothetical protein
MIIDDQMVEQGNLDASQHTFELSGEHFVHFARFHAAGRMIVRKNHGGCIVSQCPSDNFPGIDMGPSQGTSTQLFAGDQPTLHIEKQTKESLRGLAVKA